MSEIYNILRLAAALWVFNFLKPELEERTQGWGRWGSIVTDLLALVISAVIVYVVTGRLLARPRVRVDWVEDRVATRGPCVQLSGNPGDPLKGYNVQLSYEGSSAFSWFISKCCAYWGGKVVVSLDPEGALMLVRELGAAHSTATCQDSRIRFDLGNGLSDGTRSWIDVSLQSVNGPDIIQVKCEYRISVAKVGHWASLWIFPIDSEVKQFEVRRP